MCISKKVVYVLLSLFIFINVSYAADTTYTEDKLAFSVKSDHPEFVIKLISNPTTGYSWALENVTGQLIEPVKHEIVRNPNKKLMGAPGYELWTFKAKPEAFRVPTIIKIKFFYSRPWEVDENAKPLVFQVTTQEKSK